MQVGFVFHVVQEPSSRRWFAQLGAVNESGQPVGVPVGVVDAIYSRPEEVVDQLVSSFRAMQRYRAPGIRQDELQLKSVFSDAR